MAEVKWIKITTNMFEDEKIDFIESLPESDAILVIWIKLLAQAGKNNVNGFIFLTEKIPYTDEMLAHKFRRPLNTVKLALNTLKELEMITYSEEGFLKISNWEKHQNVEGLDKIREQTRLRVARHREKQEKLGSNVTCNVTVTEGNETELDKNRLDKNKEYIKEYLQFFEDMWKLYPIKRGKGQVSDTKKIEIFKVKEEFPKCIERYKEDIKKRRKEFPDLKMQNGSTFFNSGYIDFLDENYKDGASNSKPKEPYKPTFIERKL